MKIKNKLLLFLGIFIFMIIPKNVFASTVYPWYANIDNSVLVDGITTYDNNFSYNLAPNESVSFGITVYGTDYSPSGLDISFDKYPYVLFYFQTFNTIDQIGINKNPSCNSSCFNNNNIIIKQIGKDASSGRFQYIMILQAQKWVSDCGVGSGQCFYKIEDRITLTNKNTSSSTNKNFNFYQVFLSDDSSIYSDTNINIDSIISDANQNRQQIQNSISSASSSITNSITNGASAITDELGDSTYHIIDNINTNKNDQINNANQNQAQTNERLDNVNNSLNSEEAPTNNDVSNKTTEWSSKLAGTGPVSNMVLMPITLLNGYVSGLNSTCTPYNLGNLMGTDIILPCVNISNYVGVSLWNVIDILFSGFMIYAIGKKFVKIFNDFTNLRDNQMDELYGGGK